MNFSGIYELDAKKDQVWSNLNNPNILKECIDGCKEFTNLNNNEYKAKILIKLGPLNASFQSIIKIKNIKEGESYDIEASGNAGQLGYASGIIQISLKELENKTILNYSAESRISGKIAQLGSRLIDGSVRKNTDIFFNNFRRILFNDKNLVHGNNVNKDIKYSSSGFVFYFFIFITLIIIFLEMYAK